MFLPEYRVYESAALDRAEYSLQQGIIVIALVCGGLALGAAGIVRLTDVGLRRMPRVVAAAASLTGAAVLFFGVAYARTELAPQDEPETSAAPQVSLEPIEDADRPRDVVHGVVRTASGDAASDVDVELVPLFSDEGAQRRSTRTDDGGAFVFTDVEVTPGTPYVVDVYFDGATFPSQVLRFGRDADDPVRVIVAGSTRSARSLTVDVESIAIVGDRSGMQVVHAIELTNRGKNAFVGGLRLPLLPGATAISPGPTLDRRHLELADESMISTAPVTPGRHEYTYAYIAAMHSEGLEIHHRPAYPTTRVDVLLSGDLTLLTNEHFTNLPAVRLRGRTYQHVQSHDLEPTAAYTLRVVAREPSSRFRLGVLALAALIAVGVVSYPLLRRRRKRSAPIDEGQPVPVE